VSPGAALPRQISGRGNFWQCDVIILVAMRYRNPSVYQPWRYLLALFLLAMGMSASPASITPLEARKIDYLIAAIETLPNAQFIRNGTAYDGKGAADHLRLKLQNAGSRVATAEDFIRLCASVSSMSGLPYQIRFADGHTVTSETFLRQKLLEFGQAPDND
jgi:hypothetical protein